MAKKDEVEGYLEQAQMFTKTDWHFMIAGLILTALIWFMGVGVILWMLG